MDVELDACEAFFSGVHTWLLSWLCVLPATMLGSGLYAAAELPDRGAVRDTLIVSKHFYSHTPPDDELRSVLQRMRAAGAAIPKLATTAQDVTDALRILVLAQQSPGERRCRLCVRASQSVQGLLLAGLSRRLCLQLCTAWKGLLSVHARKQS